MNIGIDLRSLLSPTGRGVSHYATSLVEALITAHPEDHWHLLQTGRRVFELPEAWQLPHVRLVHRRQPNKLLNVSIGLFGRPRLDQVLGVSLDAFFAPNLGFVRLSPSIPLVLTVHDASYALYPQWYSTRERLWHRAVRPDRLLKRAHTVIAVSGQTKHELHEVYGLDKAKVQVIHSGIDDVYRQPVSLAAQSAVKIKYELPEQYVLFIGAAEPRKNLGLLFEGYRQARLAGLKAELAVAGPPSAELERLISATGGAPVHQLGYVPEADKPALYAAAQTGVLVSRHEGFGFPPLEALAAGTPSIVSNLPVFAETLGKAAVRVSPEDPAELAQKLVHLERHEKARQQLVQQGAVMVDRLRWAATAEHTYAALRAAGNHHAR